MLLYTFIFLSFKFFDLLEFIFSVEILQLFSDNSIFCILLLVSY